MLIHVVGDISSGAGPVTSTSTRGSYFKTVALAAVGGVTTCLRREGTGDTGDQAGPSLVHGRDAVAGREVMGGGLVEGVDVRLGELPRGHVLREQDVELLERAVLRLGGSEVRPDEREQRRRAPHEAGEAAQIPGLGVHEVWLQHAGDDAHDVICVAGQADRLLSEAGGAHFGRESPPELPGAELEQEGPWTTKLAFAHARAIGTRGGDSQTRVRTA